MHKKVVTNSQQSELKKACLAPTLPKTRQLSTHQNFNSKSTKTNHTRVHHLFTRHPNRPFQKISISMVQNKRVDHTQNTPTFLSPLSASTTRTKTQTTRVGS